MELGLLEDDRRAPATGEFIPSLTPLGWELRAALEPKLKKIDLRFPPGEEGIPGTSMSEPEAVYNEVVSKALREDNAAAAVIRRVVLRMHAVQQMLGFLYHVCRSTHVERNIVYERFFKAPFVRQFMDQEGIEEATQEASRRRCPFLLNLLEAINVIKQDRSSIIVKSLVLIPALVRPYVREAEEDSIRRLYALAKAWPDNSEALSPGDLSILRELFGANFLTEDYPLKNAFFLHDL